MFLDKVKHWIGLQRSVIRGWVAKQLTVRYVTKVLRLTHAEELQGAPRNEWALIRSHQLQEIKAVASGQIDIVDRRSWSYPYLPEALHRLNQPVLKNTPYNLRRFSETPVPRRAINLIKNAILSLKWVIEPIERKEQIDPDMKQRIDIATECFKRPNNTDSYREFTEAWLEDLIIGGYGCIEPRLTPYWTRPVKMWPVDGSTIRIFLDWTESTPDRPRFAQMTGLKGERGIVTFLDGELVYVRDNVRTSTPFGMGKLEVAFNTVNAFLGAQDMAGKAGSDQIHKTWLWWEQTMNPAHIQTVRRHIINELEGQAKLSLMAGAKKPDVIEVTPVKPEDLLLDWQRFMIEIIALAFDLSPMALGQTDKVNKATGQVMADSDFRSAVVPTAKRVEEAYTRHILHGKFQYKDLQFRFVGLEDPDALTRTQIQQRQYMMNAITPDEIREADSKPKLPGGFGRLTMGQFMLLQIETQAKLGAKAAPGGAGAGGKMGSGGAGGMSGGMGSGGGTGAGIGMLMSAQDVAQMQPDDIQLLQELGVLPPGAQLPQQMEEQQPGILEEVSDELKIFFEHLQIMDEESQIQPAPVTPAQEREQVERWEESEHDESVAEKVVNRRGMFGPAANAQVTKNPERGKYPRSGGRFVDPNLERAQGDSVISPHPSPTGHYRPGKKNLYK